MKSFQTPLNQRYSKPYQAPKVQRWRFVAWAVLIIFLYLVAPSVWALSDDSCRDRNGLAINSRECIDFRKAAHGLSDSECFQSSECRAQRETDARVRREREEQTKIAEQEEIERAAADREKRAVTAANAIKAKCGDDYKSPKIGMSIDRVRACVTPVKMTAQLSRTDGVVTTYEGGGAYFHVMDGRVLGWGKY